MKTILIVITIISLVIVIYFTIFWRTFVRSFKKAFGLVSNFYIVDVIDERVLDYMKDGDTVYERNTGSNFMLKNGILIEE